MDIGNLLKAEIDRKKDELAKKDEQNEKPLESPLRPVIVDHQEDRSSSDVPDLTQNKQDKTVVSDSDPDESILRRLQTRPQRIERAIGQDSQISTDIDPVMIGNPECRPRLSMQCNLYIHKSLQDWSETEYQPHLLPETKRCLFPMLVRLRKSNLDLDLLTSLATVIYHLQRTEFQRATESYMKLSIGNVAWPIGVTSVGIHARSAQSRIQGDSNVANIMIDDKTRLWITSVKRLITFKESCHQTQ